MSDKRKNNGGARTGSGRKPKADEIKLLETMDAIAAPVKVWKALFNKVEEGDTPAIKVWLSYRYGMPKQQTEISGADGAPIIVNIIAPDDI